MVEGFLWCSAGDGGFTRIAGLFDGGSARSRGKSRASRGAALGHHTPNLCGDGGELFYTSDHYESFVPLN